MRALRTLHGAAQRVPVGPGETLPGGKEGSLRTHEDSQRGSFAMSFMSIAKLLAVKQELRRRMHEPIVLVGALPKT